MYLAFVTIGLLFQEIMKLTPYSLVTLLLTCQIGLIVPACSGMTQNKEDLDQTPTVAQTIPPATLTAISELAAPSRTPDPNPLGVKWSDLDGQELEFWYIWDLDEPGVGMNDIVDRFNRENEWGITVIPRDQGLVLDPLSSVESAFEDGKLPHIMIGESSVVAGWYQSGLIVDLNPYLEDLLVGMSEEDLGAFYPGVFNDFILDGSVRPGMPFSQSIENG